MQACRIHSKHADRQDTQQTCRQAGYTVNKQAGGIHSKHAGRQDTQQTCRQAGYTVNKQAGGIHSKHAGRHKEFKMNFTQPGRTLAH